MSIFDSIIKRKSKTKAKSSVLADDRPTDKFRDKDEESVHAPEATEKKQRVSTKKTAISSRRRHIIIRPWVTEKARDLSNEGTYVFLVTIDANKHMVRNEIEREHEVSVVSVRMIRGKHRSKRFAGKKGHARMYKKALVTVAPGQKLDVFSV